jgi:hypothetical protein
MLLAGATQATNSQHSRELSLPPRGIHVACVRPTKLLVKWGSVSCDENGPNVKLTTHLFLVQKMEPYLLASIRLHSVVVS